MNLIEKRVPLFYACLLGHSTVHQAELRLAIRFSHPVILHNNKRADIIHDVQQCMFFYDQFLGQRMTLILRSTNDL